MIQRIQTIFLLLAAAFLIAMNFLTLGVQVGESESMAILGKDQMPIFVSSAIVGGLSLLSVLLFKNRVLQMNVVKLNIFLTIIVTGLIAYFIFFQEATKVDVVREAVAFPLLAIICLAIGLKKINADEKLVRSIDRLR